MQQLRWRYSCDPNSNTCCVPTEPSSVLATRLGIRGLVPLTEASCADQPGCMSQQHCYPSWVLDSCRTLNTSAACLAVEQCQVRSVCGAQGWVERCWLLQLLSAVAKHSRCSLLILPPVRHPHRPLQWYGNEQWGSCVDATLMAKCQLAGASR